MPIELNIILLVAIPIVVTLFVFLFFKLNLIKNLNDKIKHIILGVIFGLVIVGENLLQFNHSLVVISTVISTIICIALLFGIYETVICSSIGVLQLLISFLY